VHNCVSGRPEVWAHATETPELDPILPIRHLLELGMNAVTAQHGREEGTPGLLQLSQVQHLPARFSVLQEAGGVRRLTGSLVWYGDGAP
jgi:hypothetical protein